MSSKPTEPTSNDTSETFSVSLTPETVQFLIHPEFDGLVINVFTKSTLPQLKMGTPEAVYRVLRMDLTVSKMKKLGT